MRKNKDRGERVMMKGRPLSGRTFIGDLSDETAFELKDTQSWYSLKGVSEDIYMYTIKKNVWYRPQQGMENKNYFKILYICL